MTKIEETMSIYALTSRSRGDRRDGHDICGLWAEEIQSELASNGIDVHTRYSTRTVVWPKRTGLSTASIERAVVPLNTVFPEYPDHMTEEMSLYGTHTRGTTETYRLTLTVAPDHDLDIAISFDAETAKIPEILQRFRGSFGALKEMLKKEREEEQRAVVEAKE